MHGKAHSHSPIFGMSCCTANGTLTITLILLFIFLLFVFLTQPAQAQTYEVIYNFTGGLDGVSPHAGLTIDQSGNFYGQRPRAVQTTTA